MRVAQHSRGKAGLKGPDPALPTRQFGERPRTAALAAHSHALGSLQRKTRLTPSAKLVQPVGQLETLAQESPQVGGEGEGKQVFSRLPTHLSTPQGRGAPAAQQAHTFPAVLVVPTFGMEAHLPHSSCPWREGYLVPACLFSSPLCRLHTVPTGRSQEAELHYRNGFSGRGDIEAIQTWSKYILFRTR